MNHHDHEGRELLREAPPPRQWPAYEVFEQRRDGEPYVNAGTVHAADPEMALLSARDVFARRPTCVGLWVAPAAEVFRRTNEQLAGRDDQAALQEGAAEQAFCVFRKTKQAGPLVHCGTVNAVSQSQAIEDVSRRLGEAMVWWVVSDAALLRSRPEDAASMFAPASNKPFRDQASYQTVLRMHQIKQDRDAREACDETKEAWSPWSKM